MKQMKKFSTLAVGSMAIGLLLGASLTQAEDVCLDNDNETVIAIKGLDVVTKSFGTTVMDVDFTYATGFDVYGANLQNLPFAPPNQEDDPFSVISAIQRALNKSPLPTSAGQPNQTIFYIGSEAETAGDAGALGAFGSANPTGQVWDNCKDAQDCILGVAVLQGADRHVYADLKKAVVGATCDGSAPPPGNTFTITPGITGSWYDIERDGEGYNIEIVGSALEPVVLAYFYTYDSEGNQMWLVGSGPANGDTAIVPVQVTSGPFYGDEYKKEDVVREDWGTLTFTFSSCMLGSVVRESTIDFFGTTTVNFERLTTVVGVSCP